MMILIIALVDTKMNGVSSAFNRFVTGQNLFLTDFYYDGPDTTNGGTVCFGTDFPSKILRFTLEDYPSSTLICQRGAYLASNATVNIEMEFTKSFTTGFFGGQGFVLQKLSGIGDVLVKGGGTIQKLTLRDHETVRVASGCIVAFESTIDYNVTMMPGIQNAMFGGEGLFITTLTGPGQIWLQGMPPDRMIAEIARRVPSSSGIGIPIGGGFGGSGGGTATGAGDEVNATESMEGTGSSDTTHSASGDAAASSSLSTSDAAIDADRNATIASSGIPSQDANSPSALFGDAAASSSDGITTTIDNGTNISSFETDDNFNSNDSFTSSSSTETTFIDDDNDDFFQGDNVQRDMTNEEDGELFNDDKSDYMSSSSNDTLPTDDTGEASTGVLKSLWNFFTGNDE
jgi:uncharacterized protein (AIM24 family)